MPPRQDCRPLPGTEDGDRVRIPAGAPNLWMHRESRPGVPERSLPAHFRTWTITLTHCRWIGPPPIKMQIRPLPPLNRSSARVEERIEAFADALRTGALTGQEEVVDEETLSVRAIAGLRDGPHQDPRVSAGDSNHLTRWPSRHCLPSVTGLPPAPAGKKTGEPKRSSAPLGA